MSVEGFNGHSGSCQETRQRAHSYNHLGVVKPRIAVFTVYLIDGTPDKCIAQLSGDFFSLDKIEVGVNSEM